MQMKRLPFRALCLWEFYALLVLAAFYLLIYVFLVPFTWLWFALVGGVFCSCAAVFPALLPWDWLFSSEGLCDL